MIQFSKAVDSGVILASIEPLEDLEDLLLHAHGISSLGVHRQPGRSLILSVANSPEIYSVNCLS